MRLLLPTVLLIVAPVFVCRTAAAQPGIAESGTSPRAVLAQTDAEPKQLDHTRTWLTLGALVAVLAAGMLVKRKVSRNEPPAKGTAES